MAIQCSALLPSRFLCWELCIARVCGQQVQLEPVHPVFVLDYCRVLYGCVCVCVCVFVHLCARGGEACEGSMRACTPGQCEMWVSGTCA